MSNLQSPLERLVDLIQVEGVGKDRFRGESEDIGTRAVFGGQVLGQALIAACMTAPPGRKVHSIHGYFLLPGQHASIDYAVVRVRDGGSFSTRRVVASQQGAAIFEMLASYQATEEGVDRHDPMPPIPGPEGVVSESEHRAAIVDLLPSNLREKASASSGIEYRPVIPFDLLNAKPREARTSIWLRASGPLPDAPMLHQALLAYASDHGMLLTATLPHGLSLLRGDVRLASIDHAMWFHRDFRIDDWLLYQVDSPTVQAGRAMCRGVFYSLEGKLIATTMQEGLMRVRTG